MGTGVGKTEGSCLAEIESETGRLFICASVVACEALLEDAGQILRCDADAGIADAGERRRPRSRL